MPDTPYNDALDVLATALKAGPAALAHQSGPAARTNFVDRLTTIAHRLDLGGHGGVQEVYEAASIIGRLQKGPKRPKGEGWSIEDHLAIADLEKVQMKLVKLANGVQE